MEPKEIKSSGLSYPTEGQPAKSEKKSKFKKLIGLFKKHKEPPETIAQPAPLIIRKETPEEDRRINRVIANALYEGFLLYHNEVEQFLQEGQEIEPGESKEYKLKGRKCRVILTNSSKAEDASDVKIHIVTRQVLGSGTYAKIHRVKTLNSDEKLVEKRRIRTQHGAAEDIANEYKILTTLQGEGIQARPYAVIRKGAVVGFLRKEYDGDGYDIARNKQIPLEKRMKLFHDISVGMLNIWEKGYFHNDHKLNNTLYEFDEAKMLKLVVSDLGGAVSLETCEQLLDKVIEVRNTPSLSEDEINQQLSYVIDSIRGHSTFSNPKDEKIYTMLVVNLYQNVSTKENTMVELKKLMEADMAYAHAIAAFQLFTNKDPVNLVEHQLYKVIAVRKDSSLTKEKAEKKLSEIVDNIRKNYPKDPCMKLIMDLYRGSLSLEDTMQELKQLMSLKEVGPILMDHGLPYNKCLVLVNALNNNYNSRPTLAEFVEKFQP